MHPSASDDAVLLEHLQLANQQLRAVLADAGTNLPELPLPADLQQVHEEEAMPLLAEENYQLRQLLQQLQHQQQLQDLEQQLQLQQELELNRSALEFGRLSPTLEQPQGCSPMALGAEHSTAQFGSPPAADPSRGWASPHAPPGAVMSPVAMRLVAAPSLNTVQLVEAEAAAQLATQATIQAEAEAHQHMSWPLQQTLQNPPGMFSVDQSRNAALFTPCHEEPPAGSLICSYDQQQQQHEQAGVHRMHPQRLFADEQQYQPTPSTMAAADPPSQQQVHTAQAQQDERFVPQHGSGNGRLALPQLPRLTLPRSVAGRRSMESTCSDVGRSSVCSGASGDLTWRSHATGATSHQPLSATGAASARSNASSSCGGLKQLANDLLLLPPALRASAAATGPDALQETFGSAGAGSAACADYASGARGFGVGHAGAAAGMAADAAAGIWYPAAAAAAAAAAEDSGFEGSAPAAGAKGVGGVLSPSSRAAGVAVDAVRGMMYPGALPTDQMAAAEPAQQQAGGSRGIHAPPQPAASSKGGLRLPQSVFAGATGAAAVDVGDVASSDQWYGQQHAQMLSQQQQQQPVHQPPDFGAHGQMPALPPIATSARRGGSGPLPQEPAQSGASAVSQAAAAAAALAGQRFHMQQLIQQQQAQQPFPALRLPPRAQTHQQHQQEPERRSSSFDSSMSDIPPSLPKLRMPAARQSGAAVAGAGAGGPPVLRLQTQTGTDSYDSSPAESPLSDSGFFRAADSGLFEGGGNGLFDGATDLFGARISMDDSGQRLSCSEAQPSQLPDVAEDYFGLPDSGSGEGGDGYSYCASQQSGWLGVSYQQQWLRGPQSGLSSARGSQQFFQPMYGGAASAEDGSFGAFRRGRGWGQSLTAADTIDELSELQQEPTSRQDTRNSAWSGSAFIATAAAGSMSSLTSGALSHQVSFQGGMSTQPSAAAVAADTGAAAHLGAQQQERDQEHLPTFPNLAPLRVSTERQQQDQTPPLTWRPQPLRVDSGGSTARSNIGRMPSSATAAAAVAAATSPAHMAATEAAEAAASVGLAAAATGGMDSLQLQQLLNHLARVAEEASTTVNAAAAIPAGGTAGRTASAPAGPPSSRSPAGLSAGPSDTPADVLRCASSTPVSARAGMHRSQQEQGQQGQQLQDCAADGECFAPVSKGKSGDQEGSCGSAGGQPSRPLSPFAAVGAVSPAPTATGGCLVMSPRPPALQRTLSAGQVGPGAAPVGLPPKWASRSGSSSNLTAMHSQLSQQLPSPKRQPQALVADDTARDAQADQQTHSATVARAVPDRAATMPVPAPAGSLISSRLGLHGRLRVITHAAGPGGYSSNGSNSDADAGSTHTTPMHRPPQGTAVQRSGSGSSFRPAGLASITVPPSPASSGVRYVPASPRVVGFDCPLTPHAYALRSPSWRSEVGVEGSSVGAHPSWVCGSGSSTPRRQASSPGLLQQALSRSGLAPQQHHSQPQLFNSGPNSSGGSGCNTPSSAASAARRAASAAQGLGAHGAGASAFAPPAHAIPVAAPGSDKGAVGSHGSIGQLKQAGSCSSSALLMTMMGGQLPVLHHQRTSSSPYMDSMQSPRSARRMRSSASGFEAAVQDAHAARATLAPAALPSAPRAGRAGSSNASSRRSSSESGSGSPGRVGVGGTAQTGADAGLVAAAQPQSDAATAVAGIDVTLELSRSVSPQLRVSTRSRSVSPKLQQVTSPPAHAAQACAEAGQHKLSRFGLAAARASTEKPLTVVSAEGVEAGSVVGVPEQGLTAVLMTVGQAGGSGLPDEAAAAGSSCAGHCDSSTSSSQDVERASTQHQPVAAAAAHGAAVVVPDTPAVEAASGGAAFAAQYSLEHELPAAVLIEQELQRVAAEEAAWSSEHAAPATVGNPFTGSTTAAGAGCSNGCSGGAPSSSGGGTGSSREAQRVSWSADTGCPDGGCEHHGPPASPCTPQQEAEQQQQQQLQSPDRQQDQHQHQEVVWQQVQHQIQQHQQGAPLSGGSSSAGGDHTLPRLKSAAAYLAGDASAAAGSCAASETGTPTASSAASGMWSPTHDVRAASCRHMRRSPSALLMRLAQKQVEVLTGRGKASCTVPYVLPHRSSNPASALRALATGGSADCSSSQCADQSAAGCSVFARTGSTPRSSLDLGLGSSTSTPRAPLLQPESSWEVEPLQPAQNLIAVASSANPATDVYIPLPGACEAQQQHQQQQPQHVQTREGSADADEGSADKREVLLSAAIVQQRLKSTSKWLGPAPVVAASAAATEAKAAAVVSRQRNGQQEAIESPSDSRRISMSGQDAHPGSSRVAMTAAALTAAAASADVVEGGLFRSNSSSGSGRVALAAAALSAGAAASEGTSLSTQRSGSSGTSSRVAAAAAALAASGTGAASAAASTPARMPAKVRPADAWLAAGPSGAAAATDISEPSHAKSLQEQSKQAVHFASGACHAEATGTPVGAGSKSAQPGSTAVGPVFGRQVDEAPQMQAGDSCSVAGSLAGTLCTTSAGAAAGVMTSAAASAAEGQPAAEAVSAAGADAIIPAADVAAEAAASSAPPEAPAEAVTTVQQHSVAGPASSTQQGVASASTADSAAAAQMRGHSDGDGADRQAASGDGADQVVQLDSCSDAVLTAVRSHQQQLLKQRQLLRQQQQQRKRQEVAAWAQQHADATVLASGDVAAGDGARDVRQASPDQVTDLCAASASDAAACHNTLPSTAVAAFSQEFHPDDASAAADAGAVASPTEAADTLGHLNPSGLGPGLGMQGYEGVALSVADDFEVHSWAAWSTTSSINRCPKLQWWGHEAGQGRFSQRQQRRLQQQQQGLGMGAGRDAAQARWWQRLLQARQEGGQAGRPGNHGSAAGPSGV